MTDTFSEFWIKKEDSMGHFSKMFFFFLKIIIYFYYLFFFLEYD